MSAGTGSGHDRAGDAAAAAWPTAAPHSPAWPTAATRPVFLLGWPARHSLSPVLHNAAFHAAGLDLVYLAAPVPPDHVVEVVRALTVMGAVGANVTVPHKRAVVAACDHLTDEAQLIGAVNTLHVTEDGLLGDNTDARGLLRALEEDVAQVRGARFVLLGTGGAARAAAVAIGRLEGSVHVVGRRQDAAGDIAALARRAGSPHAEVVVLDTPGDVAGATAGSAPGATTEATLATAVATARVVINATPLGMAGEELPAPLHALEPGQVAYDLVYEPAQTPFLAAARARGAAAHNGLAMLLGQAAVAFERWTGQDAPVGVMRAAVDQVLRTR